MMLAWKPKSPDVNVASVRYRCMIPLRELQSQNFPVELFNPANADSYAGIIFSKCYDIADQQLARVMRSRGSAVVLDLCDNHFYNPYGLPVYETARKNLLEMIGLADLLVCSTPTLADFVAAEAGLGQRPRIVGDPVEFTDTAYAQSAPGYDNARAPGKNIRLLWFGIHGSPNAPCGMTDLCRVAGFLREIQVNDGGSVELVVCSNSRSEYDRLVRPLDIRSSYIEYNRDRFPELLGEMDGVVLPVSENPFTWAKSHNRLTTALFAGVPVVADSVPSYLEFSAFCTLGDWRDGLREIVFEPREARRKASEGREYILQHWMPCHVADQWREVLSPLVRGEAATSGLVRQ
jgi:hypothetical protein